MKILIADDQTRRYSRLIEILSQDGVNRENIDIVPSASDAREKLKSIRYDLLVLDILLPYWPEQDPSEIHSLDLLTDLHVGDDYHKPGRILGISAEKLEAADKFTDWTWTVVNYSESNDDWLNRAHNCVRYIQDEKRDPAVKSSSSKVDLAIICALQRPEFEEVLKLNWNWEAPRPLDDVTFVSDGHFMVDGLRITVSATFAPRMGMVSTALRSAAIITLLRPKLIAMCGICAGVKGKANIGDVLFADSAWDYQSGKRVRDKDNTKFSMQPHQLIAPALIRSHVEQLQGDSQSLSRISEQFGSDAPGQTKIIVGPVASGSAVIADDEVVKEVQCQQRDLKGIEMEIYGMYAAAHSASRPQPLAFALKAVCDYADLDKEDKHQRYAAYASANVLRLLMEKFGPRLLSEHEEK